METLKIRFKLHALEYEVEGHQDVAKEEFKNFNDNILSQLLSKVNIVPVHQITAPLENNKLIEIINDGDAPEQEKKASNGTFPTLKDIKLRDLAKNEVEWLIVYCFYASNFGTKEFTGENILELYKETGRRTENRIKSLSQYLKVIIKADYIKSINDNNFIILPKGVNRATDIAEGRSKTGKSTVKKSSLFKENSFEGSSRSKGSSQGVSFIDLNFDIGKIQSLRSYCEVKCPKSQNDEVAVVLQWFQEHENSIGATLEEINYLIKISTGKVPSALAQVLINMKGPKLNLLQKSDDGKYTLTSLGMLHVNDLPLKSK